MSDSSAFFAFPNSLPKSSSRTATRRSLSGLLVKALPCFVISCAAAGLYAQDITAANLEPFVARQVGTTSDVKTVRVGTIRPMAISSISIAPGFTEFSITTPITDCVVDGHTVNPAFTGCQFGVTFHPKSPGKRTAPLIVTDSVGNKYSVGLEGLGLAPQAAFTPGIVSVIAGGGANTGSGIPATSSSLYPSDIAILPTGEFYLADNSNYYVYKVDTSGILTRIAGNGQPEEQVFHGSGGPATKAAITPSAINTDAAGNLYIAGPLRVVKVYVNGVITVVAGNGQSTFSGDGGPAVSAGMIINGITIDDSGNLYIADGYNNRVRKVDTNGIITTVAGNGTAGATGLGGPAVSAELSLPQGLAVDNAGNLYIAEQVNNRVTKVDTSGVITLVAGTGNLGSSGDGGPATQATFWTAQGVSVDAAGNIYVLDKNSLEFDGNNRIRRIDATGTIRTVAGGVTGEFQGAGLPADQTVILPYSLSLDSGGNLYISEVSSHQAIKVDVSQPVVVLTSPHTVGSVSAQVRPLLTNTGNQHLDLGMPSITGDFNLLSGIQPDCSSSAELGAGVSCALRVTFAPTEAGKRTGTITLSTNTLDIPGTVQTISLTGTGVNP